MNNNIQSLIQSFSNREIAILIWLAIGLITVLIIGRTQKPLAGIVKLLFSKTFLKWFALIFIYISLIIYFLFRIGLWNFRLTGDTLFWIFGVALILVFNLNKAENINYFKKMVYNSIRWTIIIEFIFNFYEFSIAIELTIIPIMIVLALTKVVAGNDQKLKSVDRFISNVISTLGIIVVILVIYKAIKNFNSLISLDTLRSFLSIPLLTILFIPFLYLFALYAKYEMLFLRIGWMVENDKIIARKIRYKILRASNLNLNKLNNVSSNLLKSHLWGKKDLELYMKVIRENKPYLENEP